MAENSALQGNNQSPGGEGLRLSLTLNATPEEARALESSEQEPGTVLSQSQPGAAAEVQRAAGSAEEGVLATLPRIRTSASAGKPDNVEYTPAAEAPPRDFAFLASGALARVRDITQGVASLAPGPQAAELVPETPAAEVGPVLKPQTSDFPSSNFESPGSVSALHTFAFSVYCLNRRPLVTPNPNYKILMIVHAGRECAGDAGPGPAALRRRPLEFCRGCQGCERQQLPNTRFTGFLTVIPLWLCSYVICRALRSVLFLASQPMRLRVTAWLPLRMHWLSRRKAWGNSKVISARLACRG